MIRIRGVGLIVLSLLVWFNVPAFAGVTINQVNIPVETIAQVTDFDVTGDEMAGMLVTFKWIENSNNYQQTVPWVAAPGNKGSAEIVFEAPNNYFNLNNNNNTFANPWDVSIGNKATGKILTGITLDGFPGNTVFDRSFGYTAPQAGQENLGTASAFFGTSGSALGSDFLKTGGPEIDVIVTYRGPVQVGANAAVGDIFRFMDVDFGAGLGPNDQYSWKADTDSVVVPIPGAVLLLGAGVARLVAYARRRQED
jgi:hypothetical protein